MKDTFVLLLLILAGCSTRAYQEKRILAWETWKNVPVAELETHAYFKNLKVKKLRQGERTETWLLKDQTPFQTGAYCQSLGGCLGYPSYNCENIFSVENGVILGMEQKGSCPGSETIEAKRK